MSSVKYQVTLHNAGNYTVGIPRTSVKRVIDVDLRRPIEFDETTTVLSALSDVDSSNRAEGYLLMWDAAAGRHVYVPPFVVVDRADSVGPVLPGDDSLDYGTF